MTSSLGGTLPGRLALIGIDGHIHVQRSDGSDATRLTWNARDVTYGLWNAEETVDRLRYFWPTWSPAGDKLACLGTFGTGDEEQGTGIYVLDTVEQVQAWELWTGSSSAPIYLAWAPDNDHLALVVQQHEALSLVLTSVSRPGEAIPLLAGVPLFHRFSPDSRFMAVHLGGRFNGEPGRRLYHIDLAKPDRRLTLSEHPGLFGTPSWSPDGAFLAYANEEGDSQIIFLAEQARGPHRRLGQFTGIGAMWWSPDGKRLLVAVASSSPRHGYEQVWSYPVDGSAPELLLEDSFTACFSTAGERLVYLKPAPKEKSLTWKVLEPGGRVRSLSTFYPTQPQLFQLRFFHQYAHSHRLVSPDGTQVLFAGYLTRQEMEDDHTLPRIFVSDLARGGSTRVLAEGSIGCWAPADPPAVGTR